MFRKAFLASVLALLAANSVFAVEPATVFNKFLRDSEPLVEEIPLRDVVPSRLLSEANATPKSSTNSARVDSLRTAQRPKSVLQLSEERISDDEIPAPTSLKGGAGRVKAEAEAKRIESRVERKMQGLERSLKREEKRLESRLQELGAKRDKALGKGDVETLKRIERSEKQAVIDYEKRIERLLVSASREKAAPIERAIGSKVSSPSFGSRSTVNSRQKSSVQSMLQKSVPSWNRNKAPQSRSLQPSRSRNPVPKPQPTPKPQKRRFKLWPFR